jgi:hypothetical protein
MTVKGVFAVIPAIDSENREIEQLILQEKSMADKPNTVRAGTVQKIIKSPLPDEPEKAEIAVDGADDLYREIRIENTLTKEDGDEVALKEGAQVDVIIEADPKDTDQRRGPKRHSV